MRLNAGNVNLAIEEYLGRVRAITLPSVTTDVPQYIRNSKRSPLGSGPYPQVSIFEAFNRILSDLVVLFGARKLLTKALPDVGILPYEEYEVGLGISPGFELIASAGSSNLNGAAFDVAKSFFRETERRKKLRLLSEDATHKIMIFNSEEWPMRTGVVLGADLISVGLDMPAEIDSFR